MDDFIDWFSSLKSEVITAVNDYNGTRYHATFQLNKKITQSNHTQCFPSVIISSAHQYSKCYFEITDIEGETYEATCMFLKVILCPATGKWDIFKSHPGPAASRCFANVTLNTSIWYEKDVTSTVAINLRCLRFHFPDKSHQIKSLRRYRHRFKWYQLANPSLCSRQKYHSPIKKTMEKRPNFNGNHQMWREWSPCWGN